MKTLELLNGQQGVIDATLACRSICRKEVIVAVGLPGVGVTWTLDRSAEAWQSSSGASLQARGEGFATERKLFPWLTLALPGAKNLARFAILKGGVAQSSRAIPVVGAVTSYIVEELLDHRRKRLAREAVVLG